MKNPDYEEAQANLTKLRTRHILAWRDYCDEWIKAYEEVKNVSFADKMAMVTDAGLKHLQAQLEYADAQRSMPHSHMMEAPMEFRGEVKTPKDKKQDATS